MIDTVRNPRFGTAVGCLQPSDLVRDALVKIESGRPKMCLVVNADGKLLRSVTDGDVRRGLLAGLTLESALSDLPGREPVCAPSSTSPAELKSLFDEHRVSSIILLDEVGRPVDICSVDQVVAPVLLSSPHIGDAEERYVQQAFDTNWIAPAGPNLALFERRLAEVSGRREAVAVSSGTAGLHLALRALDLPKNARIYVSDKTFVASVQPVLYEGMTPVLIDAEPHSWNLSADALERQLIQDHAANSLPGAIIVVHLYGQSAQMNRIMALAGRFGIPVIEDAAESLGALYDNRASGAHGLISVFSFNGNKIITTSGGGAVVTDDPKIAERVRYLSTQGRDPFDHYQHSEIAYNYRMSNVLASVGLGQLEVLHDRVAQRRAIFARYLDALSGIPGIGFQQDWAEAKGNRWLTVLTFDPDHIRLHPYQVMRALSQRGIETRPSWKPLHMQPLLHSAEFVPHSQTEAVSSNLFLRALCLPSGSNMSQDQQDRVIGNLTEILHRGGI